jgi:hypothetical protein
MKAVKSIKSTWTYLKEYDYIRKFKMETWYFFRPHLHIKDTAWYFNTENLEDAEWSYNNRHLTQDESDKKREKRIENEIRHSKDKEIHKR